MTSEQTKAEMRALNAVKKAITPLSMETQLRVLMYWITRIEEEGATMKIQPKASARDASLQEVQE